MIALRSGDFRKRHGEKSDVPEGCGEDGASRKATLDPGIPEKACGKKSFRSSRAAKEFREVACNALVKLSPAEIELGLVRTVQMCVSERCGSGSLPQQVERIVGFVRGHGILHYNCWPGKNDWQTRAQRTKSAAQKVSR